MKFISRLGIVGILMASLFSSAEAKEIPHLDTKLNALSITPCEVLNDFATYTGLKECTPACTNEVPDILACAQQLYTEATATEWGKDAKAFLTQACVDFCTTSTCQNSTAQTACTTVCCLPGFLDNKECCANALSSSQEKSK